MNYYSSTLSSERKVVYAVVYARVSTDEQAQEGRSIPDQIAKAEQYATERGYTLRKVFKDEGFSGSTDRRPALQEMIIYCQQNDVDKVLVLDTDRLARNEQLHFAVKAMLKKNGTSVESINQPMLDDSPEGQLLDSILAAVNAFQPKITGRKTAMTMQQKAESGWWPGQARTGYLNVTNHQSTDNLNKRTIAVDPVQGPLHSRMFELYASGTYSLTRLADQLYAEGMRGHSGNKINASSLQCKLRNPFYVGKYYFHGKLLDAKHPPLTTPELFERCGQVLAQHNRYADRKRKHTFLLSGFAVCGLCGHPLTAEHNVEKGRSYYHCAAKAVKHSNKGQNVEVSALEEAVAALFGTLTLPEPVVRRIIAQAREILRMTHENVDKQRQQLRDQRDKIEEKHRLVEQKLLKGVIDDESFKRMNAQLKTELLAIEKEEREVSGAREENIETFERLLLLARDINKAYQEAPYELRRRYLALFWEKIVVEGKEIKEAVPTKAFRELLSQPQLTASHFSGPVPVLSGEVITSSNWLPLAYHFRTNWQAVVMLASLVKSLSANSFSITSY